MSDHQARQQVIDTANAMMRVDKQAALSAYEKVHPVGHVRCTERCQEAHRQLLADMGDANTLYSSRIWGEAS